MKFLLIFGLIQCLFSSIFSQVQYVSPIDQSKLHLPEATIIIRQGSEFLEQNINKSKFEISGEISGKHDFDIAFSSDKKTIILKPQIPFSLNEKVVWKVKEEIIYKNGRITPFASCFYISSKDLIKNSQQSLVEVKADIPENYPDFEITKSLGYYDVPLFIHNISSFASDNSRYMSIINEDSSFIYSEQNNNQGLSFTLQEDYFLTYWGTQQFMVMDTTYTIVDSFSCGNGYLTDWHEFLLLPGNHGFVFSYDPQPFDMTAYLPTGQSDAIVEGLVVQEIDSLKNVIFQWRTWDYFEVTDATHTNFEADYIAYVHGNSMDICPDGNLLLSSRLLDEATKINRNTGDIIWRFGGINNMFEFTDTSDFVGFSRQHDVRMLENGNITMFDNGMYHDIQRSYGKEYSLDTVNMTATLVWSFHHPTNTYATRMGSLQRLPNGNTLICWGLFSTLQTDVSEVDVFNNIVYEFNIKPLGHYVYRVRKFEWNYWPNAINEIFNKKESVLLYPNPAKNSLSIKFQQNQSPIREIQVFDISGKHRCIEKNIENSSGNEITLDVSNLESGLYFVKILTDGKVFAGKFLKL
ncbi:MAG: aryl-sulfate sulfotransferase [Bacteroidales bacterium]|nr:aryl-sulfate sulfotransferase [Bacteroidales bacterium]